MKFLYFFSITETICSNNYEEHKVNSEMLVRRISSQYFRNIESEVLNLHSNSLPKRLEFYSVVKHICIDVGNSDNFCRDVINKSLIKTKWLTSKITENKDITSIIELEIPIQSKQFSETALMRIYNIGFINKGHHFSVDIPPAALILKTKIFR